MTTEAAPLDISAMPEVARLAEDVARTGQPRVLRRAGRDLAVLAPVRPRRAARPVTDADVAAALAASWDGLIDPDVLKRELDEARSDDQRPPWL